MRTYELVEARRRGLRENNTSNKTCILKSVQQGNIAARQVSRRLSDCAERMTSSCVLLFLFLSLSLLKAMIRGLLVGIQDEDVARKMDGSC